MIDHRPSHPQQLGLLGIGHGGPQRNDFGRVWIAMGPALDPSTMRIVVFPGVFLSSSSPISPIFRVKPASAKRRQIETNPRDSLGFFVSSSKGVDTARDDSGPFETSIMANFMANFEWIVDSFEIVWSRSSSPTFQ